MNNTVTIVIDLTNVSREDQEELKLYLEEKCWAWIEKREGEVS